MTATPASRTELPITKERLVICPRCFELRGSEGPYRQRCNCEPRDEQRWRLPSGVTYDFNKSLELCHCCAASLLVSGSRWTPFYCEWCKSRVMDLNRRLGCWAIPIGRHTWMHALKLGADQAEKPEELKRFVSATKGLFGAMTRVSEYRAQRVRENLERLGLATGADVPLPEYLERAQAAPDREAAFEGLLEALTVAD